MTTKGSKLPKNIAESHVHQINVLKALSGSGNSVSVNGATLNTAGNQDIKQLQITEISTKCGFKDEKETQRYLFILEGQKLVTPMPEGDFTSKTWAITRTGQKAVRMIQKATTV